MCIGWTLQTIQTGLVHIWMVWTGWTLPYLAIVQKCEFSPVMCMKCEVVYRKPHIVNKTHSVSPTGSTVERERQHSLPHHYACPTTTPPYPPRPPPASCSQGPESEGRGRGRGPPAPAAGHWAGLVLRYLQEGTLQDTSNLFTWINLVQKEDQCFINWWFYNQFVTVWINSLF